MSDDYENGFSALLDELENLHDKNGNRIGKPFPFRKSHQPARIARVTRSEPVAFKNLSPRHRRDYSDELDRQIESLNKAMSNTRAATIRACKPHRMDLRKTMTDFNTRLQKAMISGEITPDQACLLEARRNRLMQRPMTGLI